MEDVKTRVVSAVINFLKGEFKGTELGPEKKEGLEIAIQCLMDVYDVSSPQCQSNDPSLTEIYKCYLHNPYLLKRLVTDEEKAEAEALKTKGNSAMVEGRFVEALQLYTKAIECDPRNPVYYCNRAATKSRMGDHTAAVRDCQVSTELAPGYSKAYGRMGLAYCGLERYVHAVECYQKAYDLEPTNEVFRSNLQLAKERVKDMCALGEEAPNPPPQEPASHTQNPFDIGNIFSDPQLLSLASQAIHTVHRLLPDRDISDIINGFNQSFTPAPDHSSAPPPDDEAPNQETSRNF